ncbi:MAG: LysR family transcriptional regulator [Firmicutes bacterium]|nr:LysR family transcriptional regulator [Bacillota bacterium]
MDTRYIREFVILADCLSYSEAANQLFISQSALSKHIMTLEKEVGQTLFKRTTRSIELSDAGSIFLHYATKIALIDEDCRIALDAYNRRRNKTVTLAVIQNPEYYNLAKYVVAFRHANPELTLNLVEEDEKGMKDLFDRKEVNLIATFEPDLTKYNFMPMVENSVVALVNSSSHLANKESISMHDLSEERLLLPKRNSTMSRVCLQAFCEAGIVPDIFYEGSSMGCTELVKEGLGTSLHAREFASAVVSEGDPHLRMVEVDPPIHYRYGIVYRDESELSEAEHAFLRLARMYELQK